MRDSFAESDPEALAPSYDEDEPDDFREPRDACHPGYPDGEWYPGWRGPDDDLPGAVPETPWRSTSDGHDVFSV